MLPQASGVLFLGCSIFAGCNGFSFFHRRANICWYNTHRQLPGWRNRFTSDNSFTGRKRIAAACFWHALVGRLPFFLGSTVPAVFILEHAFVCTINMNNFPGGVPDVPTTTHLPADCVAPLQASDQLFCFQNK